MLGPVRTAPRSWSATLLLPKSVFPPRALPADRPKYLKRCTDEIYAWQRAQRTEPTFTLHDGPPYANGSLHVGHALNKVLKDIVCRHKVSQGRKVDYVPGWDCHGLPIELKAIEQHRTLGSEGERHELDPVSLRHAARELATRAVEEQKGAFRGWGIMADWNNAWKTMDKGFEVKQLGVFKSLVKQGLIYRRFKPVYWSPSSRTALAEAELEYKEDHVSTAAYIKFPLQSFPSRDRRIKWQEVSAVIWTTTPWTLPANKAIGIHSGLDYKVVESASHGLLLVAASRLNDVQKACNELLQEVTDVPGADLVGLTYADSAFRRESRPILHADFVSSESGSGLVHLAPGHGMDDYQFCLQNGIEAFAPLDNEGRFTAQAAPEIPELLLGKEVLGAGNRSVIDYLRGRKLIIASHQYKHKYPYDWRSKQPVVVRATKQWFANVGDVREAALQSLDSVKFIPESGKERLRSFVKNRTEWCISRQRAWGVPIPALYHTDSDEALLTEESISHIASVIEERGIDAWWTDPETDPFWTPPSLRDVHGQSVYIRGKDTMDVWFDSGTSWTQIRATMDSVEKPIADVYLEGSDQHRGWFQSSLLTRVAQENPSKGDQRQAPFKTLITHGFTLDEHCRKMSKSIGNVISPDEIMAGTLLPPIKRKNKKALEPLPAADSQPLYDAMGPDALRLWVASCDFTNDVIMSQTVLKAINSTLSKCRVTFKLLLGMLDDFSPPPSRVPSDQLHTIHQIALVHLRETYKTVLHHYENYEFNRAVQEINRYINTDLSAFYIESIKDTIYADSRTSSDRNQAQLTLLEIYTRLQNMLYPITPLLIEEAWDYTPPQIQSSRQHPGKRITAVETPPYAVQDSSISILPNRPLEAHIPPLLAINAAVKSAQELARADKKMGSSLQCQVLFRTPEHSDSAFDFLQTYEDDLAKILVVSAIGLCEGEVPLVVTQAAWSYKADLKLLDVPVAVHVFAPRMCKCVRCWKYNAEEGKDEGVALCRRCEKVVEGLRVEKPELFEQAGEAHEEG